ncbi:hypothetical protein OF83DRAFT_1039751, partial [Amylostereum chailletii]
MGQTYDYIPEDLIEWAVQQEVFWVATAPLSAEGHVNVSPKGVRGTFRIVDKNKVWYEDLTGSGVETLSHLRENGRITIMFIAFQGGPRILRFFGRGVAYEYGSKEYEELLPAEERNPGSRGVIVVDVHRVGTSCGWGVPFYDYVGPRTTLSNFGVQLEKKSQAAEDHRAGGLHAYWKLKNMQSIDGIPGLRSAPESTVVPRAPVKEGLGNWTGPLRYVEKAGKVKAGAAKVGAAGEWARPFMAFVLGLVVAGVYVQIGAA